MIFISAGHHDEKRGASINGFSEYPETVAWADTITSHLDPEIVARVPDGVLRKKAAYINRMCPDGRGIALEVHFNAAVDTEGNPVGNGCLTLYYPGSAKGKQIARTLQKVLVPWFPPDRGVKEGWFRLDPSRGTIFFLRKVVAPAVLIEPQFLQFKDDIQNKRDGVCKDIADALAALHQSIYGEV